MIMWPQVEMRLSRGVLSFADNGNVMKYSPTSGSPYVALALAVVAAAARKRLALRSLVEEVTTSFDKNIAVASCRRFRSFLEAAAEGSLTELEEENFAAAVVGESRAGPFVVVVGENRGGPLEVAVEGESRAGP